MMVITAMMIIIKIMTKIMMLLMPNLDNFDGHEKGEGKGGDDHQDRGDGEQVGEETGAFLASWTIFVLMLMEWRKREGDENCDKLKEKNTAVTELELDIKMI